MARADAQVYDLTTGGGVWTGGAQGTALTATGPAVAIRGGEYAFEVEGSPVGATISLQAQFIGAGNWSDVTVAAGGAAVKSTTLPYAVSGIHLPACNVRCALTGGAPTGILPTLVGLG